MRRVVMMAVMVFATFGTTLLVKEAQADDHTYGECLQAASYQLAECEQNVRENPEVSYTLEDCWDTFYFLRDDELGCRQFPGGFPPEV